MAFKLRTAALRGGLLNSTVLLSAAAVAASAGGAFAEAVKTAPADAGAPAVGLAVQASVPASEAPTNVVQAVVVTGSRIRQPNLAATSPLSTVSSAEIKLEGATDAVSVLNQLPQVASGGAGSLNNTPNPLSSSGGFATVNLRGLGNARTLVLEDGRRLMPGDPTLGGEAPDIDQIPVQLIDRIDVVTGGASAVYGSDAVAGVVNFILKHNFQGVQFDVQGGFAQHDNSNALMKKITAAAGDAFPSTAYDGTNFIASMMVGANAPDGNGNVTGYLNYRHQDPVTQGARDFSACQTAVSGGTFVCSGSSNSNYFQDNNGGGVYSVSGTSPNNVFIPRSGANVGLSPPTIFNSNPYEYLSRGDERYQAGFLSHYQVKPWADLYADFSFMDDRTQINVAPTAAFRGPVYTVNCANPLLSAQQVTTICTNNGLTATDNASLTLGRRNIEGGPRHYSYEHLSYRAVAGVRGDISEGWHYDAYAQYGYTKFDYREANDFSYAKINNALNVVNVNGVPTCAVAVSGADANCVPYNIFSTGGVTKAALKYIREGTQQTGNTEEQVVSANLTGDLIKYGVKSPFATDGLGISLGTEYRREALAFIPDAASSSGDVTGAGTIFNEVAGSFDVYELFGELRVPIVQNLPFVKDLTFDGAYRFSDYSTAGNISAYKFGLEYAPTSDVRFRASYQRAVRAPNVNELFAPQGPTNGSYSDPCAVDTSSGTVVAATATLEQCMRTGVTAAQYGNGGTTNRIQQCPSNQCGVSLGGNTQLRPEKSDTTSFGIVFTPSFFRNFDLTLDYYRIDVRDEIGTISPNISLQQCLTTGASLYCGLIHRSGNGELVSTTGFIDQFNINAGYLKTSGFDLESNYRFNLADLGFGEIGRLSFNFVANYTQHFITNPAPGLGTYDCAGYYGVTCNNNGQILPRITGKLRTTYRSPWKWSVSGQWRYIGSVRLDANQPNTLLNAGAFDAVDARLPDISYFDVSVIYPFSDTLSLRAGVSNILDKTPPIVSGQSVTPSGGPNTYPNYDLLGRQIFVGLTVDF